MDHRNALAAQRSLPPPQRSVSSSHALPQPARPPPVPSRLSHVRSFSQPVSAGHASQSADVGNDTALLDSKPLFTTSPDVIDLSDDDAERPAKRAKTSGHASRPGSSASDTETDLLRRPVPGSPLPPTRNTRRPPPSSSRSNISRRQRTVLVDRAARRSDGLEPPSIATRLPSPKHVADFSPWNGKQPEDTMNETVVKAGYFDKPAGLNTTEYNSARSTIWPNLSQKNNMGLQTLSYLFSQVMEKRQQMGKCTASSTFKPPPRVTVTDTKREAWLRDLSNPDVPLRKQSRTIPHGIRGKPLLEHCLSKEIPLPRAVWLAKCVGANELRAFRRKGVSGTTAASGELKWVRDWTVQVELFVEAVVADCGKPQWRAKMEYALKLATSFYAEQLLERDHYLDWIISSLAKETLDRLPIWVLLAQVYWKDMIAFGRRGRHLAEALLESLHRLTAADSRTHDPVRERLHKLVMVMAVTNRGCLLLPRTWQKHLRLLTPATLSSSDPALESPAQNILRRNLRLTTPLRKTPQNTRCSLLELYSILDTAGLEIDFEQLLTACSAKVQDVRRLIPAVLNWSASIYRTGDSRIFLAYRLMRELFRRGVETDAAILDYLKTANSALLRPENIYRVIAQLVHVGCFLPGSYLQWLMTSGILYSGESSSLASGLLAALPLDALPAHLCNTRNSLMRRLGHAHDDAALDVDIATEIDSLQPRSVFVDVETFSLSAKFEMGRKLLVQASTWAKELGMTLQRYCVMRTALQRCHDLPALAEVAEFSIYTNEAPLLATIGDTVNLHAKAFAAIGCLESLLDQLLERYRTMRSQQALDRTLIVSLTALVRRFQNRDLVLRLLENDLAIYDQQNSMAVCSPASDSLINMQATLLDSDHDSDIDAVFSSGNTMDEQLMQRVFNRITQRAASKPSWPTLYEPSKVCRWLDRLRTLDASYFDSLAKNLVKGCLKNPADNTAQLIVVSALIVNESLRFDDIVSQAKAIDTSLAAAIAIRMLTSQSLANHGFHAAEAFRLQTQQANYCADSASNVIALLAKSMDESDLDVDDGDVINLMLEYSATHTQETVNAFTSASQSHVFWANYGRMEMHILNLPRGDAESPAKLNRSSIIALANPLSIVHCAAALDLSSKADPFKDAEDEGDTHHAILEAISNGCEVWPQLLDRAGWDTMKAIYHWAREQVLSDAVLNSGVTGKNEDVKRYLEILDVAHRSATDEDVISVISMVTEKLKAFESRIQSFDIAGPAGREREFIKAPLGILLHLSILFSTSTGADNDALNQSRANLLGALCTLLVHPKLQAEQLLLEYIYDVASALADGLPIDALTTLARSMSVGGYGDSRLASILGTVTSPDAWLALVAHPPLPGAQQQQRTVMKQASAPLQQQTPGRPVPPSPVQQQPTSQQQQPPPPTSQHQQPASQQKTPIRSDGRTNTDTKTLPFPLRRWEIISDATPSMGDNDTSLSLTLFGARKV